VSRSVKIISYNIQEGGSGRLSSIASVLRQQEPDIVALLEAGNRANVEALAHELSMEIAFGEANTPIGHMAWLSRLPIHRAENHRHPGLAKTLLEIEVNWADVPLHLFATHLSSRWDPPEPVEEIPIILDLLRSLADQPHLLVGDFNALRPGDPVGPLPEGVEKRGDAADGAPRDAIRLLLDAGYIDCYRAQHSQSPGYTYPSTRPWLRLDYIFASPPIAASLHDCDIVNADDAVTASDHLPIWAVFRQDETYEGENPCRRAARSRREHSVGPAEQSF